MSFTNVRIASNERAAVELHHIVVDLGQTGIEHAYTKPGQFVQLAVGDGKPGFYAIASGPGTSNQLEFLIKYDGETSQAICALKAGDSVRCSAVMGNGFPLENVTGCDLLLFATGSGISAIRSVIESDALKGRTAKLYYGARTPEHMAYAAKFQDWESLGVQVIPVMSRPVDDDWDGETGYVQHAYSSDPVNVTNTAAVFCGPRGMVEETQAILSAAGMVESRFLTNF